MSTDLAAVPSTGWEAAHTGDMRCARVRNLVTGRVLACDRTGCPKGQTDTAAKPVHRDWQPDGSRCAPMGSRHRTAGGAIVVTVVALLLAACAPSSDPAPGTSTARVTATVEASRTTTPTPSVDPTVAAAEAAVLKAYRGYWDAKVAIYADPPQTVGPDLQTYAVDQALADVGQTQFTLRQSGIVFRGSPSIQPTVSDVHLGDGGSATITDCVDSTNWQPVYAATGASAAAPGQETRLITVSTAYFYDGRWTIRASVVNRDKAC